MKKTERKAEIIKTAIITFLFIVAMLMVFFHFDELRKRNENATDSNVGDSFTLKSTFSDKIDSNSEGMLLPSQIAFKNNTDSIFAICSGKNYMEEIYSMLYDSVAFMLSSKCTVIEDDAKAFDDAIASNKYIYVRYHTPLPFVLLYFDSIGGGSKVSGEMSDKISSLIVSELIIFPEESENGSLFALSKEPGGKVQKFLLNEAPLSSIGIADLEIYREAGAMVPASFYSAKNESIVSSTLIFDDMPQRSSLTFTEGITGLSKNTELQTPFAEMLSINPNKTGSYFDDELDGTVYMATHGTLTFTDDAIEYSTLNNTDGIPLSIFSGKESDSSHSMYECLSAARAIASIISDIKGAQIGEGHLLLTDLFRNDQALTLKFGYFYDNVPISSKNDALILEITSEKLVALKFYPSKISSDRSNVLKSLPAGWVIGIAEYESKENEKFTLIYKYEADESGTFFAEWKPLKIKG